jgi:serine/threonine protein kinase
LSDHDAGSKQPSPNNLKVGEVVFDKYKIVRFINSGGNGRVYRATDIFRNVDVALKTMVFDDSDTKALIRFQSEARTASKFKHPNIATIYDFGLSGNTPYLTMEFVEGESLEERLSGSDTLDLEAFCEIFFQIAIAVQHAHRFSIVHRDLKPQNVMVNKTPDGSLLIKVLDFGVAKSLGENDSEAAKLTTTGGVVGSPLYMSPEQAAGKQVTIQSDLYSLGAMMFRSLTGRFPLRAASSIETIMLVASTSPPKILTVKEDLPVAIAEVVDGLLSKDPNDRPDLAEVVIPTLKAVAESLGTNLETPQEVGIELKSKRLRPIVATIFGAVFILILAGIATLQILNNSARVDSPRLGLKPLDIDEAAKAGSVLVNRMPESKAVQEIRELKPEDFKASHQELVDLENSSAHDDDLLLIPQPEIVTELRLNRSKVLSLDAVPRFKNLKRLYLGDTAVGDEALTKLAGLKLETLDLEDTRVSDAGLKELSKIKTLSYLILSSTKVTPAGFKYLRPLIYLRNVYIGEMVSNPADLRSNILNFAPRCSIWFNNIEQAEIDKLKKDFPDISFNETDGEISSRTKAAEDKIAESNPASISDYRAIVELLDKVYGTASARARRPHLGLATAELKVPGTDTKEAIAAIMRSIKMSQETADRECELNGLQLLTMAYLKEKNCVGASSSVNQTIDLLEKFGVKNSHRVLEECLKWSSSLMQTSCIDRAQQIAERGLKFGQKMKGPNMEIIATLQQIKGKIAEHSQRYDEAITWYAKSAASMDTLKSFNKTQCLIQISNYVSLANCEGGRNNNERAYGYNQRARALCQPDIPNDTQLLVYRQALFFSQKARCSESEFAAIQNRLDRLRVLNNRN